VSRHELAAAAITDPRLRADYLAGRRLNAEHGRTFYLATLLLPPAKRPYVHALYGFARYADDIVDRLDPTWSALDRAAEFERWSTRVSRDLEQGSSTDPIGRALIDTIRRWDLPLGYFADFLDSMRMDLVVDEYETYADLRRYMQGSAAVIGLQMLPLLGRAHEGIDVAELADRASALGIAFQLTNFLRDIGEDLQRGRIYLPQESLRRFGVGRADLERAGVDGVSDPIRSLIAYEIDRTRQIYQHALPGIDLVHPSSRACLRTATRLYGAILDEVERADYDVFSRRVSVGFAGRAAVAGPGLVGSWITRATRSRRPEPVRRPSQTQIVSVDNTRQKPNSRSSTGA
jgi:15-cis-phytoene synthase